MKLLGEAARAIGVFLLVLGLGTFAYFMFRLMFAPPG